MAELRILGAQVSETFKATMACHIDSEANIEAALKLADERWRGTGCYYVLNAIRPEVRLAAGAINQWTASEGSGATTSTSRPGAWSLWTSIRCARQGNQRYG